MPPRRSHKKSKAGCQRCKTRKIKVRSLQKYITLLLQFILTCLQCDEVHPRCGNCNKHGVTCDFDNPESPTPHSQCSPSKSPRTAFSPTSAPGASLQASSSSTVAPFYRNPSEIIRATSSPNASRRLELRLIHHYTLTTCSTFSETDDEKVAWQVDIPTLAYDAGHLMDAILAVSALHLRALNPTDQTLVRASHGYMASALAQYSSLLRSGVTAENAEALFCTAALIAFQASASRRFEVSGEYTLPLAWFHSFQGVKTVVMASWQWLRQSSRIYPIISNQPALRLDLDPLRTSFFAYLLDGMTEQLELEDVSTREDTRAAYSHSVAFLNWAHQKPSRSRILGFAATVSRRFVELIAIEDPRTLVIIACYFAMTKAIDESWWLEGVASREVMGIFNILPQEWWGKMEWPLQISNHQGPIDDEVWGVNWSVKAEDVMNIHTDIGKFACYICEIQN